MYVRPKHSVLAAVLLTSVAATAHAQFEDSQRVKTAYLDVSIEATSHLRTAASYVADENWPEAIDLFQKLIERFGDKVVQVGTTPVYVSVRDYCHRELARMPAEARTVYRQRIDSQAESWFRAGLDARDRELLTRVVDRAFVSSFGDDALDALAAIAFEAGQFEEAYMLWKQIDTGSSEQPPKGEDEGATTGLVYPDTNLDVALIEAKKVLCRLFSGQRETALREIGEFRKRHPAARGSLGAAEGLLADRLTYIARDLAVPATSAEAAWTTFAGGPSRTKVLPQPVDIGSVQWTASLPQAIPQRTPFTRPMSSPSDEPLSYHPLVLGDTVVVCGREEVRAYDLHEGPKDGEEPLWSFRLRDVAGQPSVVAMRGQAIGSPQYTLTADQGRLYVRLGSPETTAPFRGRAGRPDSYIVCLDLAAEGKEVWPRIQPDEPDMAFEGSPAVSDGNMYVGLTRGGAMTHAFVACYDAATGAKKWRQLICESSSATAFYHQGSISHNLPTLGAGMVFYNTNLGAIAALDQRTGRVRWIATYPRKSRDEAGQLARAAAGRELSPCIYYDGLVIAMPSDGEGIMAFDALTGELRWRTLEPPQFAHMLGVVQDKLICTGNQVVAIDVHNGARLWQWSDGAGMTPYGRGILAGDYIYYPTKTRLYVLDQRTGVLAKEPKLSAQEPQGQTPGNLVIGDGYLVVAQAKNLVVFCQYDVLIHRYRDMITRSPLEADPHFRLARAAESNESFELAMEHYRTAIELAQRGGSDDDRKIQQSARNQLHSLLLRLASKSTEEKRWTEVERLYREAAETAPSTHAKLDAMLRLAEVWRAAGEPEKSLAMLQELLADDSLRALTIQVDATRSVRADVEMASRVQSLMNEFGGEIYAPFEKAAADQFEQLSKSGSIAAAERLVRTHPNADTATHVLFYLATRHAEEEQFAAAGAVYKQLLSRPRVTEKNQIAAMVGVAQAYESQRLWHNARVWWQRLAEEFPESRMPDSTQLPKSPLTVAKHVADRLGRAPYESEGSAAKHMRLPLVRRWSRLWNESTRVLIPEGAPAPESRLVLLVTSPDSIECLNAESGKLQWTVKTNGPVQWAAFQESQLFVSSGAQLLCLNGEGETVWQYDASPGGRGDANRDESGIAEIQLVDDRLFLREDTRKLVCLAAKSGELLWSYTPTEGTILPRYFASSQHVVLQTRSPGKFIVLDADGRRRFEVLQSGEPWEFAPVALDSQRLCIATDARTIQLMDLNDGRPIWSYVTLNFDQRPVPIVGPGCLLVLVGGTNLIRLRPESGEPIWSCSVSDDVLPRHGRAWGVDGDMFYCITRELNLRAFRLNNGDLAWQQVLFGPGDQWQLALAGGYVVALPVQPHSTEGLPAIFCRRSDGSLVQKLFFRPRGNEAVVHIAAQHAILGSEREVWALGRDDTP